MYSNISLNILFVQRLLARGLPLNPVRRGQLLCILHRPLDAVMSVNSAHLNPYNSHRLPSYGTPMYGLVHTVGREGGSFS